jgi:hypothetical protein
MQYTAETMLIKSLDTGGTGEFARVRVEQAALANSDDPDYAWVKDTWIYKDPRLPLVHLGMEPARD